MPASQFPIGAIFEPVSGQGSLFPTTLTRHVVDAYGSNDDIFSNGAKAQDNPTTQWTWTVGAASGKEDMHNAMFHAAKDTFGNTWVVIAADRMSQNGTSYIDFEFLQAPLYRNQNGTFTSMASNSTGGRTVGDILISIQYTNGGGNPTVFYYKWQQIVGGYDWVNFVPPASLALAATNASSVSVPYGAFGSTTYAPNAFVEAAINVTGLITFGNPCASAGFSSLLIKTKSSNTATAVLKDLVGPIQLSFSQGLQVSASAAPIQCNGGTATIIANASGGAGNYQYSLNGGPYQSGNTFSVPPGGPYVITAKDGNNCTQPAATISAITEPPLLQSGILGKTDVLCYGASTGNITATATGGVTPYTYSWNSTPVQSTATANNLPAGNYIVTITDANGCTRTSSATITQPAAPLSTSISNQVNILCYGTSTGSATVTAAGGTAPYTYSWNSNPIQTTATATNLAAGTYTATVTDAAGCVQTVNITITQPAAPFLASVFNTTNVSCFGNSTGSITAAVSGGTAPYSYSWNSSPVQTTATVTNLGAGAYTVTVTDANGCLQTATATITQPAAPINVNVTTTNVLCYGNSTGGAVTSVTGGTSPYIYSWNTTPIQTTSSVSNLPAGNYNVTVTDSKGCVQATPVSITQPSAPLSTSISSQTNVLCYGNATGSATVSGAGGTAPYTYSWNTSPVQSTATAVNLAAGSYTATVTDAAGCLQTITVTITQPSALTAAISGTTNVLCFGNATGSATVVANGGAAPYTYSWNSAPVQNTATANALPAGTYIVAVTDANGCVQTTSATITQPATPVAANITAQTNVLCFGNSTGSATVSGSGGIPPYTYSWNTVPVQTTSTATILAAGTYTATVTDANGCGQTATITITQPSAPLSASISAQTNVLCYGNNTGSATVTANGGTAPYSYSWNTIPVQTTATAANLPAGTYTVTITDASGCVTTQTATISQPPAFTALIASSNNVSCNGGNNGSASVSVTGGVAPYYYSWNSIPVQSTASANNLPAGTYTVTVIDANGCSVTATTTITQPAALTPTITVANLYCQGATDASATVNVTGGTAPHTYSWNTTPIQTNATANNLSAGTYTVTITDANGCTSNATATIVTPSSPLSVFIGNVSPVSCFAGSNGSAAAIATGGASPYTYSWNTSPVQTTATAVNLSAGVYRVIVTDYYGCMDTAYVNITQPFTPITASITGQTNVLCYGNATGTATVAASGGTPPYTYSWNTAPVQTGTTATSLAAGTYSITVTDSKGCVNVQSVTITQSPILNASIVSTSNVSCFGGNNGSAIASATGGVAPYTYSWNTNPVQTGTNANNLPAGSYTVSVTDANGCVVTAVAVITEPTELNPIITVTNLHCIGGSNGTATVSMSGGTAPYTYSWNTTPVQTGTTATNLPLGTYTVSIVDANGCTTSANATIANPANPLNAAISNPVNVACFGNSTGSATAVASGGGAPYTYSWNTNPVQTNATATGLPAGTYTVIVADNFGCLDTAVVTITEPASPVSITVNNIGNLLCFDVYNGTATAVGSGGTPPYSYSWNTTPVQTTATINNFPAGTFTATVTDANGCVATQSINITQPPVLNVTISGVSHNSCNGDSIGTATGLASGGVPPYAYSWNTTPVNTNPTISNLPAGTYTLTVTDSNGCINSASVTILQPLPINATTNVSNVSCYNGSNGSISTAITGGTAPFTYSWNTTPVQTTATAINLAAGTYTVTVTDSKGCSQTATATVTQPASPLIVLPANVTDVTCHGGSNGSGSVTVSGGTAPYNYSWNTTPTQVTSNATNLPAGTYTITIIDNNGCIEDTTITIVEPDELLVTAQHLNKTCIGLAEGSGVVQMSGGTAPYSIVWSTNPPQNTDTVRNLAAGSYMATVIDARGCFKTATITIENYPAANVKAEADEILCDGDSVMLSASGAVSYIWSPSNYTVCNTCSSTLAYPRNTTTFYVVGIDENNCRDTDQVLITVLHHGPVEVGEDKEICKGDGAQLYATGGVQYTWIPSTGLNNGSISNPFANPDTTIEYTVIITQNQCFSDTLTQKVTVHEWPTINVGPDHTGFPGTEYQINAIVTNANNIKWTPSTWLSCDDCLDPVATLERTITYTATVTSEGGCTAKDDLTIKVICDNAMLFIPNTFTPNGDGNNDVFFPVGSGIKNINRFTVYNRWGQVMFEMKDFKPNDFRYGWDGRFKGDPLTPDVYVYYIDAICTLDERVFLKGDISLIR